MSERKRKRGRPRTTPVISYEAEMRMRNNIPRNIKKPKYLLDAEEESIQSRGSTPSRNLDERGSAIKNSRGYNPDFDDKNSEFHYGSDFEEAGSENEAADSDTPSFSDIGPLSDDEGVLSDNDSREQDGRGTPMEVMSPAPGRAATPDAVWLQDRTIPKLSLPPSANDLLIPTCYFMPALGIYEVFRHFRTLVRLSPFRFEEFCGALVNPQQTVLLAEMHIALLRALIREDESQSTHFGPMDHKDSINVMLYLVDPLTWPQVLNNYLQSDLKSYHSIVKMMEKCSYPYTSLQNRLQVLRALTDEVLSVSGVREELISEGKLRYDDHCRACHKTGDLLCCDSCTAVFHLDCLGEGPLPVPLDDWTCSICRKHQVSGVTDCLSSPELSGMLCRHDPLGYDRHGRKYWFLVRRLIVESSNGEVRYYSSRRQVQAVLSMLDAVNLEHDLVSCIDDQRHELERQLTITEHLWDEKRGTRPSALHADEEIIMKFTTDSKDGIKDEMKTEVKDELNKTQDTQPSNEVKREVKVEPLDGVKSEERSASADAVKMEVSEDDARGGKWDLWGASIVGRSWLLPLETVQQVVKEKLEQLTNPDKEYRLGVESGVSYVNEYSTNTLALNKLQHNEDRDKKRHLSHKFSVSCSQEFKWSGTLYGSEQDLRECLRACLQQTETQVSSHLYHPHWAAMRKTWLTAITSCSTPRQFARCLLWFVAAIKPVVFHNVWHDALGHIRLTRVTALEREEKRRQEKKDKKDQETQQIDDFRNTLPVRFTKMPKHQLWKVKGEEYRAVCGDGWRWSARHRRSRDVPASSVGLRAGPDKMMVGVHMTGGLRGLPVAPDVFTRLAAKTPGLLPSIYSPNQRREMGLDQSQDGPEGSTGDKNEILISNAGTEGMTQKVAVKVTPLEQFFEDGLVNVSRSLVGRTRLVYPKVPAPSQLLDGLLARRVAMPTAGSKGGEESADMDLDGEAGVGEEGSSGTGSGDTAAVDATIQEIPDSQRSATHRLRPAGNLLKEIRQHKLRYEALDESVFQYRCYSPSCTGGTSTCYSPLCRAKTKTREKLLNAIKNYTIVTSKPSPYPEIGVNDVIKVSEMDFSEDSKKGSGGDGRPGTPTSGATKKGSCVASTASSSVAQQHSAGHLVGSSVELPRPASGEEEAGSADKTGQISVRLDQDLDENSQSSDAMEHKFALKEEKVANAAISCCGKVYLKKKQVAKPKKTILRLPQISKCRVGRDRYSLLVLPQHELRTAARRSWRHTVSGYHHLAKSNASVWPYPSPRPLFRLTWLYRTASLNSLSGAALQLRLLWSCLRWEDMHEKGPSDGKRHITTDTEIIQTEILKRKYSGRFSEKTEYLRRKVTIPFEVPKPVREFTPSQRSGLRKRRRAQSPEDKRPESVEEWIPEEQLLLWEIRLFGERLERAANQPKKDSSSATSSPAIKISLSGNNSGSTELKQRLEEQLKQQRAAFQQQQREGGRTLLKIASLPSGVSKPATSLVTPVKAQALSSVSSPTKKLMRTKDGRLISVQTLGSIQPASSVGNSTIFPMAGSLPKVQIASQTGNKVIRLQTVPANPRMILPRAPRPVLQQAPTPPATIRLPNQNIQILRMPDGQIQVKGLLDGQQMIQRPDGKFQLINTNAVTVASPSNTPNKTIGATVAGGGVQVTQQKTIKPLLPQQPQILKVNGQQVMLRKEGMNTQIVSVGAGEALKAAGVLVNPPQQSSNVISVNPPKTVINAQGIAKTVMQQPQQQPAAGSTSPVVSSNTAPKTDGNSLTLRVQVRMTEQGPKTIIQGLQPSVGLTKDHIRAIQQQVRSMLAQYNLKVNQLSPIMNLTLHIGNQAQQTSQQHPQTIQVSAAQTAKDGNILPQQPAAAQPPQQQQPLLQVQGSASESSIQSPAVKLPTVIALKNNASGVVGPATYIRTSSGALIPAVNPTNASVNGAGGVADQEAVSPTAKTAPAAGSQFVLTNDYIQQTIQSALNCNDLSPDVEEKLVQLRKYNTEQGTTTVPTLPSPVLPTVTKRSREQSESGSRSTKKARTTSSSSSAAAVGEEHTVPSTLGSPRAGREGGEGGAGEVASSQPSSKKGRRSSPLDDAKKKQALLAKLEGQLTKHKELLKKDILKKRALLEKELQLQIHKELGIAKQHINAIEKKGGSSPSKMDLPAAKKRKRRESASEGSPAARPAPAPCPPPLATSAARLTAAQPPSQNNKKITTNHKVTLNNKKSKNKNKKIVCICRTPFDDTKFYVGCDLCANWFHGDCVGITEALSRTMTEYVCDDCANAKLNKELYCFCRQPYDETQFYICCEQCEDWYHGRCIGIMQGEADDIDDYICPKCEPSNIWNHACQKKLTTKDYTELKKVAKTLVSHKNAWPFLEAVDPGEVPEYYKVVREPMDLRMVERRVRDHHYTRLQGFIGDVMLLLDNCRLFNPPNSSFVSCAATIESFFCSKVKLLKQKIIGHH